MFPNGRMLAVIRVSLNKASYYADERAVQLASPMSRPVTLLLGLCLPSLLPISMAASSVALSAAILGFLAYAMGCFRPRSKTLSTLGIVFVGMLLSIHRGDSWMAQQLPESCWRGDAIVTGVISDFPEEQQFDRDTQGQRFELRVHHLEPPHCAVIERIRLSYWQLNPLLSLGQRVTLAVQLRPPPTQLSPGSIPDQARNASQGVSARGTVKQVIRVEAARSPLAVARQYLSRSLAAIDTSPRSRNVLNALLIGRGGAVGTDDWQRVRSLGLSHVMVISGLHVGLVFLMGWWLIRRCQGVLPWPLPAAEQLTLLLPLGAAAMYAALAGFSLPTQRALFMLIVAGLPRLLGWRSEPLRVLLAAVLLVLILDPMAWLSSGFWLSVGATAILLGYTQWSWPRDHLGIIGQLVLLQGVVALGTLPLSLFWYGTASVMGVVANLLLVPPLTLVVVPLLLIGAVLIGVSGSTAVLVWGVAADVITLWLGALDYLYQLSRGVALQGGHWSLAKTLGVAMAVLAMSWLVYRVYIDQWRGIVSLKGLAVIAAALMLARSSPQETKISGRLVMLDVGQGLALVWQSGERTLLFDTGAGVDGGFSQVDKIVLPYFGARGIAGVDLLVVSHSDNDHSGGLGALRDKTPIHRHWGYGGQPCRTGLQERWPDGTVITVLNGDGYGGQGVSSNTASCVIRIRHRGVTLLLTGDVTRTRELAMVRFWREQLNADILVAAHHGSDTSSTWTLLKWVQPRYVLVSAARASRFGHPDPEVLKRFAALGAHVENSAQSGTVTLSIFDTGAIALNRARGPWLPFWLQL